MRKFGLISGCVVLYLASTLGSYASDLRLKVTYSNEYSVDGVQLPTDGDLGFVIKPRDVEIYAHNFADYIGKKSEGHMDFWGPVNFSVKYDTRQLTFVGTYKTHIERLTVQTDGQSTCRASISLALRPGYTQYRYEFHGLPIMVDHMRITNVRCEISVI